MDMRNMNVGMEDFKNWMRENEKAAATVEKYTGAVKSFLAFADGRTPTRELLLGYREALAKKKSARTVNVELCAVNSWLNFHGKSQARVRCLRVQRCPFLEEARTLGRGDYHRLLETAKKKGKDRLYMLMLTLGGLGLRISELNFVTVEAVKAGVLEIRMKGKWRRLFLPSALRAELKSYAERRQIAGGLIFCTRSGRPLDRSNAGHEMKRICADAGVDERKVFPHNFRHLFARAFYEADRNMAKLADILGHSSMETTRIYVADSTAAYEKILEKMDLLPVRLAKRGGKKIPQKNHSAVRGII